MVKKKAKRAAIYCRISLDKRRGTSGEAEGVERQERECRDLCKIMGYEVVGVYTDNSFSAHGTATKVSKERPKYQKMLADFREDKFDVFVAWKLDRLTRSNDEMNALLRETGNEKSGVMICTTDVGEHYVNNSTSQFLLQVTSAIAQWESSRKSERYKALYADRAQRGVYRESPTRSFGYTRDNRIIPEEAEVVRFAYEAYDRGSSINAIDRAIHGHDDGTLPGAPIIPGLEEGAVVKARAARWLRNPKYAGYIFHAPTRNGEHASYGSNWRKHIVRDSDGTWLKAVNVEPIVDEALWWRVQERLDGNLTDSRGRVITGRGGARRNMGSGLYRCGVCGQLLKTGGRVLQHGRDYGMSLQCPNRHLRRAAKPIDDYVKAAVRHRLAQPDLKDLLASHSDPSGRLGEINQELDVLSGRVRQTRDDYDNDYITGADYKRKKAKLQAAIDVLSSERLALTSDSLQSSILMAPDPVEAFDALTDPRQIAEVVDFLCAVAVHPHPRGKRVTPQSLLDEVKIEWKDYSERTDDNGEE